MRPLPHGCTNETLRDAATVVKRYAARWDPGGPGEQMWRQRTATTAAWHDET